MRYTLDNQVSQALNMTLQSRKQVWARDIYVRTISKWLMFKDIKLDQIILSSSLQEIV